MPWNKVDTTRAWKKVDVSVNSKNVVKEPFATLCVCNGKLTKIYMNCSATSLAKQLGFEHALLDAYRSGAEWAFAKGETFIFSPVSNKQKDSAYISGQELCSRIWTATKCKRFRVSVQDEFLVLTPAYDLEKEARPNDRND